jgi:uncharacterized protein
MAVPVTALYAGLLGLLLIGLSVGVINQRYRAQVGIGHGGDERLERWTRIHGNFAEYVPMALVLLALAELQGAPAAALHALGAALAVGRVSHAWGLARSPAASPGRFVGMVATFLVLAAASSMALLGYLDFWRGN